MANDIQAFTKMLLHDLRSELGVILLNADLGSLSVNSSQPPRLQTANGMIIEHARYMMDLINKADRIYTLQSETVNAQPTHIDLVDYTGQIIEELKEHSHCDIRYETKLPQLKVTIDAIRYREALNYLLEDLVQDSLAEIPIRVQLSRHKQNSITITLTNPTLNLPSEKLALIFTPFNRIQKSANPTDRGTGLGLFLARKITQDVLGGSLSVESDPLTGTKYQISLPRKLSNSNPLNTSKAYA